jgi:hypothetical protein
MGIEFINLNFQDYSIKESNLGLREFKLPSPLQAALFPLLALNFFRTKANLSMYFH